MCIIFKVLFAYSYTYIKKHPLRRNKPLYCCYIILYFIIGCMGLWDIDLFLLVNIVRYVTRAK